MSNLHFGAQRHLKTQTGSHTSGQMEMREEVVYMTVGKESEATCGQSPKLKVRYSNGQCGFAIKLLFI